MEIDVLTLDDHVLGNHVRFYIAKDPLSGGGIYGMHMKR